MAWIELIIGVVAVFGGLVLILGAANVPAPNAETDRYALYGLIALVAGMLLALIGAIQLLVKLIHVIAS